MKEYLRQIYIEIMGFSLGMVFYIFKFNKMGQDCCSANDSKQNEMMTNVENIDNQNAMGNKNRTSSRHENGLSDTNGLNIEDKHDEKNNVSIHDHSKMIASLGDYSISQANNHYEGTVIQ